jgi:hypothetical protein
LQQIAILTAPLGPPLVPDWLLREGDRWENPWKFLLGVRDLFFAICIFVNHRVSGVVDFPAPGDPMLSSHTEESTNMRLCGTDPCYDPCYGPHLTRTPEVRTVAAPYPDNGQQPPRSIPAPT